MAVNKLVENDQIIGDLRGALRDGESGLRYVPKLLRRVLEEEAWRKRIDSATHAEIGFDTFGEFERTAPIEGLGATPDLIDRIVAGDPDLLRLLRGARQSGRAHLGEDSSLTVERLASEAPDEYEAVRCGDKSIHAAAVSAGIRRRRLSIRLDSAESAAASLRKHMSPDQLAQLRRLLDDA